MPRKKKPRPQCKNCTNRVKRLEATYCSNKCQMKFQRKQNAENNFQGSGPKQIRKYLLEHRGWQCEKCQRKTWCGKPIPIEVDHINGNYKDNRTHNLKLLCPNCHAQTPTYGIKNLGNGRHYRRLRYKQGKSN